MWKCLRLGAETGAENTFYFLLLLLHRCTSKSEAELKQADKANHWCDKKLTPATHRIVKDSEKPFIAQKAM